MSSKLALTINLSNIYFLCYPISYISEGKCTRNKEIIHCTVPCNPWLSYRQIGYGGNQVNQKNSASYLGLYLMVLALEVILTLLVVAHHR